MSELAWVEREAPWEGVSAAAARAGLYEEHQVRGELVIGPEVLQKPDVAFVQRASKSKLNSVECSDAGTSSYDTCKKQVVGKEQHSAKTIQPSHNAEGINPSGYQCEVCSRKFLQKQYLTRLKWTHLVKKPFYCATCKKQFSERNDLINHSRKHKGDQSFRCDICNKQFVSSKNLDNHKQMHAGDTRYSCDVCAKQFSHKSYLNVHKRTHLMEKLYSCDVCEKQFLYKYQLSSHKQIHVIEKPYSCKNCKKQFAKNTYFIKHIWNCKM